MQIPVRIVTATSLFDGHDASINIMRRLLQKQGAEVIHLGHNRSVPQVVQTIVEENADAVAISSYQGGHVEYFKFLKDCLNELGLQHVCIFGGGGGVILPKEIKLLEEYGITRIYSPHDGMVMGLEGMIADMHQRVIAGRKSRTNLAVERFKELNSSGGNKPWSLPLKNIVAHLLTALENKVLYQAPLLPEVTEALAALKKNNPNLPPVLGITGPGGAGKSSLTDELVLRFRRIFPQLKIAVLSIDPTRKSTGGALLGDRIRMNSIYDEQVFMRSMGTRTSTHEISDATVEILQTLQAMPFDLVIVETAGIGQASRGVSELADHVLYVMTQEYGAASQLEKIEMLELANTVVINKFDKAGSADAYQEVCKQFVRNKNLPRFSEYSTLPVFGTISAQFNDAGVNALFLHLAEQLASRVSMLAPTSIAFQTARKDLVLRKQSLKKEIIPHQRANYLDEVVKSVREYHAQTKLQAENIYQLEALEQVLACVSDGQVQASLHQQKESVLKNIPPVIQQELNSGLKLIVEKTQAPASLSLSGLPIPKIAVPQLRSKADRFMFLRKENFPGHFPFTAGVFAYKRENELPKRQFAGEGGPARTNKRFHFLSNGESAKRLSVAFDSVSLYGSNPSMRPDVFGKIGESGVSIATLEDMQQLFAGFDLLDTNTSVSMTINGPAPIYLALFFNTVIAQQIVLAEKNKNAVLTSLEVEQIKNKVLNEVRGTVQADILKEDQAQNTCIFSIEFALKMMADMQEYFVKKQVNNYYSVSISGYHIAEAGANPVTQLALTLSNAFTFIEYYKSRGMRVDDFAKNFSFFFSNGLDPEYSVIGRVARRIWAIALKTVYAADNKSQRLKYHIQTSGRSLHAQEIDFNDIRTTLQALLAYYDNCNSLHTNAYDEAITTPTEESVRRAMAIQLILAKEFGVLKNDNPTQGSYLIEQLTDLVEEAVLQEFEAISRRGGVMTAMEKAYQRNKIQEESLHYEKLKHSGELPIIGVNTFVNTQKLVADSDQMSVTRSDYAEKEDQIKRLEKFHQQHTTQSEIYQNRLIQVILNEGNTFEELMESVKYLSVGQISEVLYRCGGQYRRSY